VVRGLNILESFLSAPTVYIRVAFRIILLSIGFKYLHEIFSIPVAGLGHRIEIAMENMYEWDFTKGNHPGSFWNIVKG
jgi:hypothetical protein